LEFSILAVPDITVFDFHFFNHFIPVFWLCPKNSGIQDCGFSKH